MFEGGGVTSQEGKIELAIFIFIEYYVLLLAKIIIIHVKIIFTRPQRTLGIDSYVCIVLVRRILFSHNIFMCEEYILRTIRIGFGHARMISMTRSHLN